MNENCTRQDSADFQIKSMINIIPLSNWYQEVYSVFFYFMHTDQGQYFM